MSKRAQTVERKARVLVVDDEIHIRTTLAAILNQAGFEAQMAHDGEDAIARAREWQPDLVLSDVIMPRMDGVAASILIAQSLPACKIVLLSGHGIVHDLMKNARKLGYDFELLVKPIPPAELIEHIRRVLNRS